MSEQEDDTDDLFSGKAAASRGTGSKWGRKARKDDDGHSIVDVTVVKVTDAGILVRGAKLSPDPFGMEDPNEEEWFPLSQLHDSSGVGSGSRPGDVGTLVISTWLAERKGLV